MIKYNPLLKSNGTQNGALLVAPSDSIVFDVPGKCIWVKGVKLLGTDHTYSFSNDNYITLTNTPGDPEDIKIGVNINNLLSELDKVRLYIGENNNTAANAQVGNPYIKLFYNNVRKQTFLIKSANDTNLTVTTDSNGNIIIENKKPDLNHNTDYRVSQLKSTDASDFRVLLKSTADDTNETNSTKYSQYLTFNPNTKILKINSSLVVTMADIYVGATSSANAIAGLVPAAASAQRNYFLRGDGTWLSIVQENTWRPIKVNSSEKLGSGTNTGAVDFVAGDGIQLGWDATNKKITITNSAPDLNHNTDRTGLKKGTAGSTATNKLVITNSASGLIMEGGTHKFKVGDGTNSFEIPITVTNLSLTTISTLSSFIHASDLIYTAKGGGNTVTDKPSGVDAFGVISMKTADGWYGQLLMSSNTASGVYWRTATSLSEGWKLIADTGNISNKDATLTTSLTTIATIAGVEIKAKITNYNTDENVKQTPKTDNVNRPLMMINGGTSAGELTSTSIFSTGIYANAKTGMIVAGGLTTSNNITISNSTAILKYFEVVNSLASLWMGVNASGETFLWTSSATNLILGTNSKHRLEILSDGKVGIGTRSPSELLSVNGNVISTGFKHSSHNNDNAILLAGGGWKLLSELATSDHTHQYVPYELTSTVDNVNSTNALPIFYNLQSNALISGYGSYWHIINLGRYNGTEKNHANQIAMNYLAGNYDSELFIRRANGQEWKGWRRVLHDGNYTLYTYSKTDLYTKTEADDRYVNVTGDCMTGHLKVGGTENPSSPWDPAVFVGSDSHNKVIITYLASRTNGATIGATTHNCGAWADLNVNGSNIIFRIGSSETLKMKLTASLLEVSNLLKVDYNSTYPLVLKGGATNVIHFINQSDEHLIDFGYHSSNSMTYIANVAGAGGTYGLFTLDGTGPYFSASSGNFKQYAIAHAGNITNSEATIGTSLTTIATIAGINILAKIAAYSGTDHTHSVKINGSTKTIAAPGSTAVDLGSYLPLTAGSSYPLTDTLYITPSGTSLKPNINITSTLDKLSYMCLKTNDGKEVDLGFISTSTWGVPDTGGAYMYVSQNGSAGGLYVSGSGLYYTTTAGDFDKYMVYHTGNLPAYPTKASWNYDDVYVLKSGDTMTGNLRILGTKNTNAVWDKGVIAGADGHDKVVLSYLASDTNGATIGAHNSDLNAWAILNVAGTLVIFRTELTERMRLTTTGLGIGTNSPSYKLDVNGIINSNNDITIRNTTAVLKLFKVINSKGEMWVGVNAAGEGYTWVNTACPYHIGTSAATRIYVTAGGNVGIGTTSPGDYKLYVNGTIYSSGFVHASHNSADKLLTGNGGAVSISTLQPAGTYVPYVIEGTRALVDNVNQTPCFYNLQASELISGYHNYWYVIHMGRYNGPEKNYSAQIAMNYEGNIPDSEIFIRSATTSWRPWRRLLHDNNWTGIVDGRYLKLSGGSMQGGINLNRSSYAAHGLGFYSASYNSWCIYMSDSGNSKATGWNGNIATVPSGTYVTYWALRSVVEAVNGCGWTWESMTSSGTAPSIVAELASKTGNFKTIGSIYAVNFYTTSDRNKKTNISNFSEHIRKFQLKDTEKWHYGVIAQEVPEMFRDGEEGNMTVNYNSVLSYYIGQLENKVKMLEERIRILENK